MYNARQVNDQVTGSRRDVTLNVFDRSHLIGGIESYDLMS